MRAVMCGLVLVFAVPCLACGMGGKATDSKSAEPARPSAPTSAAPEDQLPQTLELKYQGRDASQWGRDLLDVNEATSNRGALAIRNLGAESLRFVYRAMSSPSAYVRSRTVMGALDPASAKKYPDVFRPALKKLLSDESGETRGGAAMMLAACEFHDDLPAVEKAIADEKDPSAKSTLQFAAKKMKAAR